MKNIVALLTLATFLAALPKSAIAQASVSLEGLSGDLLREAARRHPGFDLAGLKRTPDNKLEGEIHHFLFSRMEQDIPQAYKTIMSLPRGFQIFYMSWLVETVVSNPGWNAYLREPNLSFIPHTPKVLAELGDPEAAKLLEAAMRAGRDSAQLPVLRERFMAQSADFSRLRIRLVRTSPNLFVTR